MRRRTGTSGRHTDPPPSPEQDAPPQGTRAGGTGRGRSPCYAQPPPAPRAGPFMTLTPFHVALQVRDIEEARRFYSGLLGCREGRSAPEWVDFDMYGHQFVCHLNPRLGASGRLDALLNMVDGAGVPVPH